jgi:hypothetical protein
MVMAPNATHPLTWTQEGNPDAPITTARAVLTCHQFLIDIAHHAGPGIVDHDHTPAPRPSRRSPISTGSTPTAMAAGTRTSR